MRRFLLCALFVVVAIHVQAADKAPPNVIWIIADDHAAYVTGAYGNKQVKTPNLDKLAGEGLCFERAYCNSPVCTASRQSFLTGRYPRSVGVTVLKTPLPDGTTTMAHLMAKAGYDTAAIGKMHFNSQLKHGFDLRLDQPEFNKHLKDKPKQAIPKDVEVQPAWKPFKDPARVWLNSACLPLGSVDDDMYDTWLAKQATDYLSAKHDKPFFLMVSFTEPHSPYHFPVEYRGRIKPESMTVPRVGPEDDEQIPAIFRELTDKEKQGIAAAYHTAVEHMDRNVGLVLDALKKSGYADNTLVIFHGDHGYMLGQHGRFEKHCSYEEAVRVPLLLRAPGVTKAGQTTTALVELIDVAPTILDYAGQKTPESMQGRSLLDLARGKTKRHREVVIAEYAENEEAMIRDGRWKLVYCTGKRKREDGYETGKPLPGRTVKLFDLDNDPGEFTNLGKKPEHAARVATMTKQLADHMKRTARQPEMLPRSDDVHTILDHCLQPSDAKK